MARNSLVIAPLSNLQLESPFLIGRNHFYPKGAIDKKLLKEAGYIAKNDNLFLSTEREQKVFDQISNDYSVVLFSLHIPKSIQNGGILASRNILKYIIREKYYLIEFLRFSCSFIDDHLFNPNGLGYQNKEDQISMIVLKDNEFRIHTMDNSLYPNVKNLEYFLTGEEIKIIEKSKIAKKVYSRKPRGNNKVNNILRMAISHYSNIVSTPAPSTKFILCLGLIEFIASPRKYQNFSKLKGKFICHLANSKSEYHNLSQRFFELTGKKDSGGNATGIRTRLLHQGEKKDTYPQL